MIDIQNLKKNLSETIDNLSRRGFELDKDYWLKTEDMLQLAWMQKLDLQTKTN